MRRCRDSARQPITSPLALTPFLATEGLLHICAGVQCVCLSPHTRRATQISGGVCGVSVRVCVRVHISVSLMLHGPPDLFKCDEKCRCMLHTYMRVRLRLHIDVHHRVHMHLRRGNTCTSHSRGTRGKADVNITTLLCDRLSLSWRSCTRL